MKKYKAIEEVTNVPLVIHGGSGVPVSQRTFLSQNSKICKFNMEQNSGLRLAVLCVKL